MTLDLSQSVYRTQHYLNPLIFKLHAGVRITMKHGVLPVSADTLTNLVTLNTLFWQTQLMFHFVMSPLSTLEITP